MHQTFDFECPCYDLGRMEYRKALEFQLATADSCRQGDIPGALLIVEHEPVITRGASAKASNMLLSEAVLNQMGISVVQTDRGGDVTYHGPGQVVAYPILDLRVFRLDVHSYLRKLEDVVIGVLAHYGLDGVRHGLAGVWANDRKICSIGIAIRRSVTYHGLALNVDPNMTHFSYINPCGLNSAQVSSISELTGMRPDMPEVIAVLKSNFERVFGVHLIHG